MDGLRIGPLWLHRKAQWDLDIQPVVCVHWKVPNSSTRVFCLWRGGVQLGPVTLSRRDGLRYYPTWWRRWRRD